MSAKDALFSYSEKAAKGTRKKARKKNDKPEKELEKQVLKWAKGRGLFLHVVESKAVYSVAAGQYLRGQAQAGFPDLIGNFESLSVWIELKAKGRRGTLRESQRDFLSRKAEQGCFAACIDSVDQLKELFDAFLSTPSHGRSQLLLQHLPKKKDRDAKAQVDDELGF